jgi:hypothetical protein
LAAGTSKRSKSSPGGVLPSLDPVEVGTPVQQALYLARITVVDRIEEGSAEVTTVECVSEESECSESGYSWYPKP